MTAEELIAYVQQIKEDMTANEEITRIKLGTNIKPWQEGNYFGFINACNWILKEYDEHNRLR